MAQFADLIKDYCWFLYQNYNHLKKVATIQEMFIDNRNQRTLGIEFSIKLSGHGIFRQLNF